MSKGHEIGAFVAQYIQTREPRVLDEARRTAISIGQDYLRTPQADYSAILTLFDIDQNIWEDNRSRIIRGIEYLESEIVGLTLLSYKKLWPPYKGLHITSEEVSKLSAGLRKAKITLAYALVRPFIGEAVERHRKHGTSNLPLNSIAAQDCVAVRDHITFRFGNSRPPKSRFDDFLDLIIQRNKEIITYSKRYGQEMEK
ncbi:MAG: hypothetical protein Q9204_008978 [Flavoplaca sp. TL-2023a]